MGKPFTLSMEITATREMVALSELSHIEPGELIDVQVQGEVFAPGEAIEGPEEAEVDPLHVETEGVDVTDFVSQRDLNRIADKALKEVL